MKRIATLLVLALSLPLAARADDASHKAKAEQMITVLHLDRMVNGVMQNAMQQTATLTAQRYGGRITPEASAKLVDFQKKLSGLLQPKIGWDVIQPEYVKLFVDTFPEDQLDTMIAFYSSPAGKALMDKLPGIEQQVGGVLQSRVRELQPQVKEMFDEFQKSLPPAGSAPAATPEPSSASPSTPSSTPGKSTPK